MTTDTPRPHTRRMAVLAFLLLIAASVAPAARAQFSFELPEGFHLADSLDVGASACAFAELPDGRILTVGHTSKRVELIVGDEPEPDPVFTLVDVLTSSEQGVLGIAIDPDYPDSNWVYIFYTHMDSTNRVSRFRIEGDLTDETSTNLSIDYPEQLLWYGPSTQRFHNAGTLRFGADETLYISHGDDALSTGNVQNLEQLHGKILRINRDGSAPPDNPVFPDAPPGAYPEIFAFGFRNPFRFCIDPATGHLFVGDVGGNQVEELSMVTGGENLGYPYYEGSEIFRDTTKLIPPAPTFPIFEYAHAGANSEALISLVCYRPQGAPESADFPAEYDGSIFWADFFDTELQNLRPDGNGGWESVAFGRGFSQSCDGALARDGGVWILRYGISLVRIVYEDVVPAVFISFDAVPDRGDVRLSWRSAVEATRFDVLRGPDDETLERVGTVDGQPGGVAAHEYVDRAPAPAGGDVFYSVDAITGEAGTISSPVVRVSLVSGITSVTLFPNEPNPFGSVTRIPFGVPEVEIGRALRVEIYDVTGRRVRRLLDATASPGTGAVMWDGRNDEGAELASGVYFSRLSLDDETYETRSLVLRR